MDSCTVVVHELGKYIGTDSQMYDYFDGLVQERHNSICWRTGVKSFLH